MPILARTRGNALGALQEIAEKGNAHIIAAVSACLKDSYSAVRLAAVEALQHICQQGDDKVIASVRSHLEERGGFACIVKDLRTIEAACRQGRSDELAYDARYGQTVGGRLFAVKAGGNDEGAKDVSFVPEPRAARAV